MIIRALPILLLCYAGTAFAGNAVGRITTITVTNNNHAVLFQLEKPIENTPRCNETKHFSIHLQKPGGMAAYMALLHAKQQGYTVLVEGLNNCSNHWKAEDVKSLVLD